MTPLHISGLEITTKHIKGAIEITNDKVGFALTKKIWESVESLWQDLHSSIEDVQSDFTLGGLSLFPEIGSDNSHPLDNKIVADEYNFMFTTMHEDVPFGEKAFSLGIGGLTIENSPESINLYGDLTIRQDNDSLESVNCLIVELYKILIVFHMTENLPEHVVKTGFITTEDNPFV